MTSIEEKKDIPSEDLPSEYRLVCVLVDDSPCGNCYAYGTPCLNCKEYENDPPKRFINWKEFQEISITDRHKTYDEFCKKINEIRTNEPELFTTVNNPEISTRYDNENIYECAGQYNESMSRCFCSYCN